MEIIGSPRSSRVAPTRLATSELQAPPRDHLSHAANHFGEAFSSLRKAITGSSDEKVDVPPTTAAQLKQAINAAPWPAGLIHPVESGWKTQWDFGIMILILYSATVVPIRMGFDANAEGGMWVFEASMSIFFLTDLSFNFNTAFMSEDGVWITDRGAIALKYLQGWFWIDAPSSIPIELIELAMPADSDSSSLGMLRMLRMFRLFRLLRLLKMKQYIDRLEEKFDISLRALDLVQLLVKMVFITHLLACGWFAMTMADEAEGDSVSWVTEYDGGSAAEGPVSKQYLYSFYWALTTLCATTPLRTNQGRAAPCLMLARPLKYNPDRFTAGQP